MAYLSDVVKKATEKKGIEMEDFEFERIRDIERDFKNKKIEIDEVEKRLREEFSYKLSDWEYKEIIKKVS